MDFQNRAGSKPGSGGVASEQQASIDRRERLRKLALETIDLNKDPYFMKNHLGTYECKLCLTLHNTEGNYLAHTQGKRHQQNLARRAFKEARDAPAMPAPAHVTEKRNTIKIGRPGYKVTKSRDLATKQRSLLFEASIGAALSLANATCGSRSWNRIVGREGAELGMRDGETATFSGEGSRGTTPR
jgi:splicing factor 3A subunit 2